MKTNNLFASYTGALLLLFPLFCLTNNQLKAQPFFPVVDISETLLSEVAFSDQNSGWFTFYEDSKIPVNGFFEEFASSFGLGEDDQMKFIRQIEDDIFKDYLHFKYKQQYKGIDIEGTDFAIHTRNGFVYLANGKTVSGFNFDTKTIVNEQQALETALSVIKADKYAWEDEEVEVEIKVDLQNETATYYPQGKLIITQVEVDNWSRENYRLAYFFEIKTIEPDDFIRIYIDANTGDLIKEISLIDHDVCVTGTVQTPYQGSQSLGTMSRGFPNNDYILQDECRDGIITTKKHNTGGGYCWICKDLIDMGDNLWDGVNSAAGANLWSFEKAWDYYKNVHFRTGSSNSTRDIRIWTNAQGGSSYDPISFDKGYDLFKIQNTWEFLDINAHEYTHAVLRHTSALGATTSGTEADALNESYSDIFGIMVDRYVFPSGPFMWTWVSGDFPGSAIFRNLSNPSSSSTPQPEIYLGLNWSFDGISHTNSGVNSYWFYLLSVGDVGLGVTSITIDAARRITYRAMTTYLDETSTYADARAATRQAAIDICGSCSGQVEQVLAAWNAVGVTGTAYTYCCSLSGPAELCDDGSSLPVTYTATAGTGSSYNWTIPVGWTPSSNPSTSSTYTLTSSSTPATKMLSVTATRPGNSSTANKIVSFINCDPCPPLCRLGDTKISDINIFPNPASDKLNIEFRSDLGNWEIQIINNLGKIIMQIRQDSNIEILDIKNLSTGIYYVRFFNQNASQVYSFEIIR